LKLFPESRERRWEREVEGGDVSMMYLIDCNNLCKCSMYLRPAKQKKKKRLLFISPQIVHQKEMDYKKIPLFIILS
jgi:hypothetical protein